jgi:hypothetical protein
MTVNGTNGYNVQISGGNAYRMYATANDLVFRSVTAGSDVMTLTYGGNLGLGVTPSAWSVYKALQIGRGSLVNASTETDLVHNAFWNGSNWIYIANDFASRHLQINGQHRFFTAPSGTAGNAISFTQAMTLDASGNLAIGSTSPVALNSGGGYFTVNNASAGGGVVFQNNSANIAYAIADTDGLRLDTFTGKILKFGIQGTERARIDSSGRLLVNTTSAIGDSQTSAYASTGGRFPYAARGQDRGYLVKLQGTQGYAMYFERNDNLYCGDIYLTTSSTTLYTSASDYRLKENIQPMTGALAKVAALNPCTYTWKSDGSDGEGFIAHEVQQVVPQAVRGDKDAVDAEGNPIYQGIDTSFLVATLTAAIQEQQAIIEQLKADVATLKQGDTL